MNNEFLRHSVATIVYRFQNVLQNSGVDFGDFSAGSGTRTPREIVRHMYEVSHATQVYIEEERFEGYTATVCEFSQEVERFLETLTALDDVLVHRNIAENGARRILQGPIADMLAHVGQLAMLSRLSGFPIAGEDFSAASIEPGMR